MLYYVPASENLFGNTCCGLLKSCSVGVSVEKVVADVFSIQSMPDSGVSWASNSWQL